MLTCNAIECLCFFLQVDEPDFLLIPRNFKADESRWKEVCLLPANKHEEGHNTTITLKTTFCIHYECPVYKKDVFSYKKDVFSWEDGTN